MDLTIFLVYPRFWYVLGWVVYLSKRWWFWGVGTDIVMSQIVLALNWEFGFLTGIFEILVINWDCWYVFVGLVCLSTLVPSVPVKQGLSRRFPCTCCQSILILIMSLALTLVHTPSLWCFLDLVSWKCADIWFFTPLWCLPCSGIGHVSDWILLCLLLNDLAVSSSLLTLVDWLFVYPCAGLLDLCRFILCVAPLYCCLPLYSELLVLSLMVLMCGLLVNPYWYYLGY
jgi:hypothetical protein